MPATYEPIATTTISGTSTPTITFSSIGATYTDLKLIFNGTSVGTNIYPYIRFNSDSATNYSYTALAGNGSAASSSRSSNTSTLYFISTKGLNTASNGLPSLFVADIFSYAGSTNKTILIAGANDVNGDGTAERTVGLWRNASAITSLTIHLSSGNFANGATATLYGIKAA